MNLTRSPIHIYIYIYSCCAKDSQEPFENLSLTAKVVLGIELCDSVEDSMICYGLLRLKDIIRGWAHGQSCQTLPLPENRKCESTRRLVDQLANLYSVILR